MKKSGFLVLFLILLTPGAEHLLAAERSWEIDKAHSNFYFGVDHIFSKVHGHFNDYSGEIRLDPTQPEGGSMSFTIDVASVDTNIAKRDKHLQSTDFFDAASYPTMTFVSTKIVETGSGTYAVTGDFTVKGATYELVLPITLAGPRDHPAAKGKEVIGVNGRVTIDRLDYKVGTGKFAEMGLVGREVEVFVTLEALADK